MEMVYDKFGNRFEITKDSANFVPAGYWPLAFPVATAADCPVSPEAGSADTESQR